MVESDNVNQLGKHLKQLIDSKSREEKSALWWQWHGNRLVRTLKHLSKGGVSFVEVIAFESGRIREEANGWFIDEAFAEKLAEQALKDPDAYDLAMKVCAVNLAANTDIPKSLRILGTATLLKQLERPSKRGRTRTANRERDLLIFSGLQAAERYGLPISNAYESEHICGAKLVSQAFEKAGSDTITKDAIVKIWKERKKSGLEKEAHRLDFASTELQLGRYMKF